MTRKRQQMPLSALALSAVLSAGRAYRFGWLPGFSETAEAFGPTLAGFGLRIFTIVPAVLWRALIGWRDLRTVVVVLLLLRHGVFIELTITIPPFKTYP